MQERMRKSVGFSLRMIGFLWVFISFFFLCVSVDAYMEVGDAAILDILSWLMLVFAFPLGLISLFGYEFGCSYFNCDAYGVWAILFVWLAYFVIGCVQWFWLVPYVFVGRLGRVGRGPR
jgi:hypothetical protein